jgi:hypothetical protein
VEQVVALSAGMLEALQALVPPGALVELRVPDFGGQTGNVLSGITTTWKRSSETL